MGLSKILSQLKSLFEEKNHSKINKSIPALLKKLKSKQHKLERQLLDEADKEKQKEITHYLKVIRAQQKKGKKIIEGLKSC
ncbi:MAG: hypothetical protein QM479_04645 [Pseudomonadota bacterium]